MADSVDDNIRIDINIITAEIINKMLKNSEKINKNEIYGNRYISISGKIFLTDMKMEDRIDNNIRTDTINGIIYPGRIHPSIN
jgi:hypothetical protein